MGNVGRYYLIKQYPEICPKCNHKIEDFMGCVECSHYCISYITKNGLYVKWQIQQSVVSVASLFQLQMNIKDVMIVGMYGGIFLDDRTAKGEWGKFMFLLLFWQTWFM